jgi:hypothetical protein
MNEILDISNNLITRYISEVLIYYESTRIENVLLDGSYHVQMIGDPLKIINITCNMSEAAKALIDEAYNISKPVQLKWYGKHYIGLIKESPKWSYLLKGKETRRIYTAIMTIVVTEEGSL